MRKNIESKIYGLLSKHARISRVCWRRSQRPFVQQQSKIKNYLNPLERQTFLGKTQKFQISIHGNTITTTVTLARPRSPTLSHVFIFPLLRSSKPVAASAFPPYTVLLCTRPYCQNYSLLFEILLRNRIFINVSVFQVLKSWTSSLPVYGFQSFIDASFF